MNRRFDINILSSTLSLRGRILKALLANSDKAIASSAGELRGMVSELRSVALRTAGLQEARALQLMSQAVKICYYLSNWFAATRGAKAHADRFLKAAKFHSASLQAALTKSSAFPQTRQGLADWTSRVAAVSDVSAASDLLQRLAKVPMPVIYSINDNPNGRAHRRLEPDEGGLEHPALSTPTDAARQTRLHRGRASARDAPSDR